MPIVPPSDGLVDSAGGGIVNSIASTDTNIVVTGGTSANPTLAMTTTEGVTFYLDGSGGYSVPGGGGDLSSTQRLDVKVLSDLPTPDGSNIINIPDNITVNFLENIDIGTSVIRYGAGCSFNGVSDLSTTFSGSSTGGPLIQHVGNLEMSRITLTQNGSSPLFQQEAAGSVVEMFDVNTNGLCRFSTGQLIQIGFGNATSTGSAVYEFDGEMTTVILSDAQLIWPQITGARCILFTSTARVFRCTLDAAIPILRNLSGGFSEVLDSVGIYVETGAEIEIFTQKDAGFRPISDGSRHFVVQDPDSIASCLLDGNTFDNEFNDVPTTGTLYGCEPTGSTASDFLLAAANIEITGITYNGTDMYGLGQISGTPEIYRFNGTGTTVAETKNSVAGLIDITAYKDSFFTHTAAILYLTDGYNNFTTNAPKQWSISQVKNESGTQAFSSFLGITTVGVNIYIAGVDLTTGKYTIFGYPPELVTLSVLTSPPAFTEIDISSLVISGSCYLDYDGFNIVLGTNETVFNLIDPLLSGSWVNNADADVTQLTTDPDKIQLRNNSAGGVLNFSVYTIENTVDGEAYILTFQLDYTNTEIDVTILNGPAQIGNHQTSSGGDELFTIGFIAGADTTTLRWKNVDLTINFTSATTLITAVKIESRALLLKETSNILQYSFLIPNDTPSATREPAGIAIFRVNAAKTVTKGFGTVAPDSSGVNSLLNLFTTSLTWDQSAPTLEVQNTVGNTVKESTARGGCTFIVTGDDGIWAAPGSSNFLPISGANIVYSDFLGQEKCYLIDKLTGTVKWTGTRDKAQEITAIVVLKPGVDVSATIAIFINGIRQDNSVSTVEFATSAKGFLPLSTLPFSADLTKDDEIDARLSSDSNSASYDIIHIGLSIT